MEQGALHHRRAPSDGIVVPSSGDSDSDDGVVFDRPIHDVAHVLDYLGWTLHSGRRRGTCDGSIAGLERGGDGGSDALFVTDNSEGVDYSLVAFSAGLPGSIHLSQCLTPGAYAKRWRHLTLMGGRKPWTDGFFTRSLWTVSSR